MKATTKLLSILLSVVMITGVFTVVPFSAGAAEAVTYVNRTWNAAEKKIVESSETTTDYTSLATGITELNSGKYVLDSDVTYSKRLKVKSGASAEIILVNGKTLKNDKGIEVPENSTLTIYGQAASGDIKADSGIIDVYNPDGAGIGAMDEKKTGYIIIKGGTVKATGGKKDAGIGTGKNHSSGFEEIAIYGGNITAQGGEYGAGIGAGRANTSSKGKVINIYGGTIKATGGDYGAGIGGGEDSSVDVINIYGCKKITANGGKEAAGIGSGNEENNHGTINIFGGDEITAKGGELGAGIGGGDDGNSGTINISGGKVTSRGGENAAGIGGGEDSHGENITISGGEVNACSHDGAGIGGGEDGKEGNIKITGGTIRCISERGAGIGGGNQENTKGSITIDGGTVYAVSSSGAGIGSGLWSDMESPITINGGNVYARSGVDYDVSFSELQAYKMILLSDYWGQCGAGIGAGCWGSHDGTITINDGHVEAFGGGAGPTIGYGGGAGIGGGAEYGSDNGFLSDLSDLTKDVVHFILGSDNDTPDNGTGGEGGPVRINGGFVIAWGDSESSAIGYGEGGSKLSNDDLGIPLESAVYNFDLEIHLKDIIKLLEGKKTFSEIIDQLMNSFKIVDKAQRVKTCQKEGQLVAIAPCMHMKREYRIPPEGNFTEQHLWSCKYCYESLGEWHLEDHDGSPCSKCGYEGDSTVSYTVDLVSREGTQTDMCVNNTEYTLPEIGNDESHISDGYIDIFTGWRDSSDNAVYEAGDSVVIKNNKTFNAVYERNYLINIDNTVEHGTLSADVTMAPAGKKITIDYKAEEGYKLGGVTVNGNALQHDSDGNYTFVMPKNQVTLSGLFVNKDHEHFDIKTEELIMSFEYYLTQNSGNITQSANYFLANDEQTMMSVGRNTTVNLCLKGHTLSIPNGLIINNGATLNIYDCSGEGKLTGGSIMILSGGTVNIYGGSIKDNNNASGVIISPGGTLNMYAGSIEKNSYESVFSGVYVSTGANFNILGDVTIQGNYVTNGDTTVDKNVYLEEGAKINICAELSDKTNIGVTVNNSVDLPYEFTTGLSGKGTAANFSCDDELGYIELNGNGEAQIHGPYKLSFDANGGSGTMDPDPMTDSKYYLPGCEFTAPAGKQFYGWKIGDKIYMESALVTINADTTAYAQWTDKLYNIWLDGHRVTTENKADILGDGSAAYDPSTNTLTLTNADIEMQEYKSGLSVGIRYNESSNKTFKIVLIGTNTIKDEIPDRNIDENYGILQFGAAPNYTITGDGTLDIKMTANGDDVTYCGIHTRKALNVDGTKVNIDIPGTEKTTGVDLMYTYSSLKLKNGAEMTVKTGSNEGTFAIASDSSNTLDSGGNHLYIEDMASKFTAESGNKVFNEKITLSDNTKSRGVLVNTENTDKNAFRWDGETALDTYSYICIPYVGLRGDANTNDRVDVTDVTAIQRHAAEMSPLSEEGRLLTDIDGNGETDISDATLIQRYLAEMEVEYPINERV